MTKRELILKAATELFSEQSYDSVGIRDIANRAGVNSAMISYYFGGKSGLLKEIFSRFTDLIIAISKEMLSKADNYYELCDLMGPALLSVAREEREIFLVGLRWLNRDVEWLKEEQQRLNDKTDEYYYEFLNKTGLKEKKPINRGIVLGAVMGMLYSDYLLGGGENIDNDELLEDYSSALIQILKNGLPSLVE